MGISYGVGICVEKKLTVKQLERFLEQTLDQLADVGVVLDVLRRGEFTLLAQGDGDHDRLFRVDDVFAHIAEVCAEEFECRAWFISGHSGTTSRLVVQGFDRRGKRAWAERTTKAERKFLAETKLDSAPFDFEVKPFFAPGPKWKRLGTLERFKTRTFTPATAADFARFFERVPKGVRGFSSTDTSGGVEVQQLFLELDEKKVTLEALGLENCGWRSPSFERALRDDPVPLPDGKVAPGRFNALRGLSCSQKGKVVTLRWAFSLTRAGHTFANAQWVVLCRAEGPFVSDFEMLEEADREVRGERAAEVALKKNDVRALLATIDAYALDVAAWAKKAGTNHPKVFDALLARLPKKRRAQLLSPPRATQVSELDWRGRTPLHNAKEVATVRALLERGAKLTAVDEEGSTPLHAAEKPEIALALIEAGASLEVKDGDDRTPVARFIGGLSFATPGDDDVKVVLAFVKRGNAAVRKQVAALTRAWSKKKTHAAALKQVTSALNEKTVGAAL